MRISFKVLFAVAISAIIIAGIWAVVAVRNMERDAYQVLYTDGIPVPESELAWVQTVASALAEQVGDPWLQQRIDEVGRYGAYSSMVQLGIAYRTIYSSHRTTPEIFPVQSPSGTYYVTREGKLLLQPPNDFHAPLPFHEGLAAVGTFPDSASTMGGLEFRYIDQEGNTVISGPFANALPFADGTAVASIQTAAGDVRYGVIDESGAWQIEPKFDTLFEFSDGLAAAQIDNPDHTARIAGFIDQTGEFVLTIDKVQRMKSSHHDGLALVWRTEPPRHIFVDRDGNTVLTPAYDQAEPFYDGMAAVRAGGHWGYIDTTGKEVIPPKYLAPTPFDSGMVALIQMTPLMRWLHPPESTEIVLEDS